MASGVNLSNAEIRDYARNIDAARFPFSVRQLANLRKTLLMPSVCLCGISSGSA